MTLHPVILAGGSGTRLWPLSREHHPKQFLGLLGKHSLLQETISRLDGLKSVAPPIFVCNEDHRFLAAHQIRQLGKTPSAIILEPMGRNTAPAVTLAALMLTDIASDRDSDDLYVGRPSIHFPDRGRRAAGTDRADAGHFVAAGLQTRRSTVTARTCATLGEEDSGLVTARGVTAV